MFISIADFDQLIEEKMQKSTGTLRSQNVLLTTNNRTGRHQRTATSNRTGGLSSSAQTTSAHKVVEKAKT